MAPQEITETMHQIVDSVGSALSERDQRSSLELIQAREPLIALENLCTQLYEFDKFISPPVRDRIADAGKQLGMDPHYWNVLDVRGA